MSDLGVIFKSNSNGNKELQDNDSFGYNSSNTRLQDFLAKTSSTTIAANVVDPLQTFDVEFKFFPYKQWQGENSFLNKLATNYVFKSSIANPENSQSQQLILNLSYYVQSMSIPQMVMPEAGKVQTMFGEFPVNNLYVKTDNNTFTMSILNTKVSLHDWLFYPWMREITIPKWSYEKCPYTTATVIVKFDKHSNSRYVFCGCRPTQIQSRQPTQEPEGAVTRDVVMLFDYMFITESKYGQTDYNKNNTLENYGKDFNNYINMYVNMGLNKS